MSAGAAAARRSAPTYLVPAKRARRRIAALRRAGIELGPIAAAAGLPGLPGILVGERRQVARGESRRLLRLTVARLDEAAGGAPRRRPGPVG